MGPVATLVACLKIGKPNSNHALLTICFIATGVAVTFTYDVSFIMTGFVIHSAAQASEAYKHLLMLLGQLLVGEEEAQISSLTLLFYLAPACTIITAA